MSAEKVVWTPRVVVSVFLAVVGLPLLPLLVSWRWEWWQAWVYALIAIVGFVVSRVLAAQRHPDLMAERAKFMGNEDTQSWDKALAPISALGGGAILLVAGLDARLGWSTAGGPLLNTLGIGLMLLGYVIGSLALLENRFFSGTVRIQSERNHRVVSTGPYAWVRHPGYAGAILTYLATPVVLDSVWAWIPAVFVCLVLVYRTALEDRFLQAELAGYREYAARITHRLIPGVW